MTSTTISACSDTSDGNFRIAPVNHTPVAEAAVATSSGGPYYGYNTPLTVTKGQSVNFYFFADKDVNGDGKASLDPDGWTDSENGVSSGGKCEWNTDLNQGTPSFEQTIPNPASASACNLAPMVKTFNDAPGTYEYQVLRITDWKGAQSVVSKIRVTVTSAISWEFSTSGNLEGWTATNVSSSSVNSGSLYIDPSGADPYISSPSFSAGAGSYQYVQIRMASNALDGNGTIYFKTQAENFYSEDKKVTFSVTNCSLCGNAPYYTYAVNMTGNSKWTGTITGIRIDPANNGQGGTALDTIGIDYIRLTP